jgi:hypothetical protein
MSINEHDILNALSEWGECLISISKAYEEKGLNAARAIADQTLDRLYGFDLGPVLFKPTLSGGANTFRPTKAGALSYFIGHEPKYPGDSGFGIKFWRKVKSETSTTFIQNDVAMWMGWVSFIDKNNAVLRVDKTFGYTRDKNGNLKIVLHHSSLPFEG